MNAPNFSKDGEQTPPETNAESESGNLVEQEYARAPKTDYDGARIMASVALFTSKSIKELEGLTFELHTLQEFLNSETERVQRDIDSAMAGLKLIIDTISPWRSTRSSESPVQEKNARHELRHPRFNLASGQK